MIVFSNLHLCLEITVSIITFHLIYLGSEILENISVDDEFPIVITSYVNRILGGYYAPLL